MCRKMTEIELKTKAEALFKQSSFMDAIKFYQKALTLKDCNAIVLNSNLSACYFEMGKRLMDNFGAP